MSRKFLFGIFLVLAPCLALAAGTVRVGVSPDYPPLAYRQDGRIVGMEADNAMAVGRILGLRMELVSLPFAQLVPALERGDIDVIMSGLSITEQRSERVMFIDSYLRIGQMAIMLKSKVARFGQPWAIYQDVRIGVEPGTTGAAFAEQELSDAEVHSYADSAAAFAALRANEIDLYVHDAPTSWRLASTGGNDDLISQYRPLTEEYLAWAVRKDDIGLAGELNTALRQMKAKGTLSYIVNRWIPVQVEVR